MNENLIALKLMLDTLGESADISSIDDRKRVQKAVYLGQQAGVDLGYSFGWYLMGPYSSSLTRDYFQLDEEREVREREFKGKRLRSDAEAKLKRLVPMLTTPHQFKYGKEDWLELLASYHYLRTASGQTEEKAAGVMKRQKGHLAPYVDLAKDTLTKYKLLTT